MKKIRLWRTEHYWIDVEAESVADAQDMLDSGEVDWTEGSLQNADEGVVGEVGT